MLGARDDPLRDTAHAETYSIVTRALVLISVVVFVLELQPQIDISGFIEAYGLIAARFWASYGADRWLPVFTSMFQHGGRMHLI